MDDEVQFAPDDIEAAGRNPMIRMSDLVTWHPGQQSLTTATGGHSMRHLATLRMKGILQLGPYEEVEDAEAIEAMLTELSFGDRWCRFPLQRSVWTGAPLYATAAPLVSGRTTLTLNGVRDDMRKGQLFTVGTPGDENTTYPDRLRRIVRIAKAGGVTTITQDPALPQAAAALGAANDAAIVRPATHVRARLATPGEVPLPLDAAAPGLYGPWIIEWIEHVETE